MENRNTEATNSQCKRDRDVSRNFFEKVVQVRAVGGAAKVMRTLSWRVGSSLISLCGLFRFVSQLEQK